MEFYRTIAYKFENIKNNIWISDKQSDNPTNCPSLTESDRSVKFDDCEKEHSFMCKQVSTQENSLEEMVTNLKESIEKQIKNLSTKIDNMNTSLQSRISDISEKTDKYTAPTMITLSERQNLIYSEGETVELECNSIGFSTIRWNGPNNNLISNRSALKIENISRFQSGLYVCIVEYEVGKQSVEQYNIQVHHTPIVTTKDSKILAGTGLNVTMTCNILSNPKPKITWVKINTGSYDNETITISSKTASVKNINNTYIQSKLLIPVSSRSDFGTYECRAKNGIGEQASRIELVGSAPFNGQILRAEQTSATSFEVTSTVVSYSPIYDCKVQFRQIPSTVIWEYRVKPNETLVDPSNHVYQHVFKFDKLNMNPKYVFQVYAQNEFGWGNKTDEFEFQPKTYVCGENGISANQWRYMISHNAHGSKGFDRLYECASTVNSENDANIEVEFIEYKVSRRNSKSDRLAFIYKNGKEEQIRSTVKLMASNEFKLKLFTSSYDEESAGFVLRFRNAPLI
ncbi:hypothetical protein B4U80_13311 [Leptotrombidium deliense]|uniref:Ig-like domain-containing protein n=1 Tax=Leptotrombidium deliense TaxID=299467 RepID=A0A443S8J1_9ACAR|nr:hypothetical protein B4U80_13311 [Leptotrombidium deliense]